MSQFINFGAKLFSPFSRMIYADALLTPYKYTDYISQMIIKSEIE